MRLAAMSFMRAFQPQPEMTTESINRKTICVSALMIFLFVNNTNKNTPIGDSFEIWRNDGFLGGFRHGSMNSFYERHFKGYIVAVSLLVHLGCIEWMGNDSISENDDKIHHFLFLEHALWLLFNVSVLDGY